MTALYAILGFLGGAVGGWFICEWTIKHTNFTPAFKGVLVVILTLLWTFVWSSLIQFVAEQLT